MFLSSLFSGLFIDGFELGDLQYLGHMELGKEGRGGCCKVQRGEECEVDICRGE